MSHIHHHDEEHCDCGHTHHHDEEHCDHAHEHSHHPDTTAAGICSVCGKSTEACICDLKNGKYTRKIYILEHLGCANCAAKMEKKISELNGIDSAIITFTTRQLRITARHPEQYFEQIQEICRSIEAEVVVREMADTKSEEKARPDTHKKEQKRDLTIILIGAVLFITGEIIGHISGIPALASGIIHIIAYLVLGAEILLTAVKNILKGHLFDENFLMSIATIGAVVIGQFEEAVGVMLFYRIGEYFEHVAVERSRSQIMDAVDLRPEVVQLVTDQEVRVVSAEEAQVGDILMVRPGDRVPLDGIVVEGESRLDTSPITGEPVPVKVIAGQPVTSGCLNTSGLIKIRVEKPLSESMVTRILDSVENAAASKPKIDRFITRFSRIYTPIVVLLALGTAVIPSLVTGDWHHWVYTALTFLVISCPCALVLSVPLSFFAGIGAGSRKGILFKGGAAMEAMSRIKAVVMDKTGTITKGNFVLQQAIPLGDRSEDTLLGICASCEQNSTHPIAVSIVTAAQERGLSLESPLSLEEIPGHGIRARLTVGEVLCGNRKLMELFSISVDNRPELSAGSEVFVAINKALDGCLVVSDTLKPDAREAIHQLKQQHIITAMLTGDAYENANAVATATGIDQVHAKLLPEEKLSHLADIRTQNGAVMFVGDGINDAPVLAGADVGAAMGSGTDAAIEAADVVFMTSAMDAIPQSLSIARATRRISMQNVVFALIIKAGVMILGLAGFASMWMAVFADTGVAMLCILNSIRILYGLYKGGTLIGQ